MLEVGMLVVGTPVKLSVFPQMSSLEAVFSILNFIVQVEGG